MMSNPESIRAAAKATASVLIRHAGEIIQRRAPELLGRDEVEAILDAAEEKYPVVTGEVKSLLSLGIIREILQRLVSEHVSIRHIAIILETLADWGTFGPAPNDLIIEQIRQSLKRQICLEYADDRLTLRVLTLDPKLEKKFVERFTDNSAGEDWADLISSAAQGMEERGFPPVVLCSPKARAVVKEATKRNLPNLAVLSYVEIPSDIRVEPVGEIRFEGSVRFPENVI
jgi:flagellar biosynthesis protein FlhA